MKNKAFVIILVLIIVLLIAGAAILYNNLSADMMPDQLQVQETPEPQATASPEEPQSTEEPEPVKAPDFTVYDKDGNEVMLSEYIGKPIVLNFWASWCGPCQMEMPDFQEKYEELGEEVTFLMVNMTDGSRETIETASEFVDKNGFTFPVLFDSDGMAAAMYAAYSLPTTFGIDAEGNAIVKAVGAIDAETLQRLIDMIK